MLPLTSCLALVGILGSSFATCHSQSYKSNLLQPVLADSQPDNIPFSTRAYWMRQANEALGSVTGNPCPFAAFGAVIVNHTAGGLGDLVCIGANLVGPTGNPTLHGEIAAINNCTTLLTDPNGRHRLTRNEGLGAFTDLSLYTNAESCPMCASAIRWAGFREYIYGTTIETLVHNGWRQIDLSSAVIFNQSMGLATTTHLLGEILTNETDPYFLWQFNPERECPVGCARAHGTCLAAEIRLGQQ
ncbi:cytidine deaminase-like protein [Thozetella sp. PMI_491]|nr:cytidine deaminase-like protein [Thozetella sp. PMI_491]